MKFSWKEQLFEEKILWKSFFFFSSFVVFAYYIFWEVDFDDREMIIQKLI